MELSFTDEQQFLREAMRGVIEREAPLAAVREWVDNGDHDSAREIAVRQGWTGIGIAEEAGGQGGGVLELAIMAEELGRGALPLDGLYASLLTALALLDCPDPAARDEVARLAGGELTGSLAQPGNSPLDQLPQDGLRPLVLGAPNAEVLVAWDGSRALELHPAGAASVVERKLVDLTRSVGDVELASDAERRFACQSAGAFEQLAARGAVLVAADALGAAQRMLELTVEYVGQRVQFGVPVGSFQAVKHAAAEMLVALEGTRSAVYYAAWAVGASEPGAATDAWVAKAQAGHAASEVADKALFLHGAVGYTWEHDLQLLFKRAKSDAQLFGGPELYEDRIADALGLVPVEAGMPASGGAADVRDRAVGAPPVRAGRRA